MLGQSLSNIVAGLPKDPAFDETIADSFTTALAGDGERTIFKFTEERVPVYMKVAANFPIAA